MSEMVIIDNEYATLIYHPETKIVHHQFHKFIHGQVFRDTLDKGTELLQKYDAIKWLSDNRNRGALTQEDMDWTQNDWFLRTRDVGWKYWALVMPDKVAGQLNMKRAIAAYSEQGITVEVFDDPNEAMEWLENL